MTLAEFATAVAAERARQDAKFPDCADLPDSTDNPAGRETCEIIARNACDRAYREGRCTFAHILDEETAEVLTAAARGDAAELEEELVQVAAVCLRWLQAIERRKDIMNETVLTTIGKLLAEDRPRDAVHMAIIPVIAAEPLTPGQHVNVAEGNATPAPAGTLAMGVVDPFLRASIAAGARFWLFLRPLTITALRHDWTHPAFGGDMDGKSLARSWVEEFARTQLGLSYDRLMNAALTYAEYDEPTMDNSEVYKEVTTETWAQFWRYYKILTGNMVGPNTDDAPFTCSC